MFKNLGTRHGLDDGMDDASYGRREHPRPNLSLSVISTGYRDAYLAAYHRGFRMRDPAAFDRHKNSYDRASKETEWAYRDLPPAERRKAMDNDFVRGWKEAMAGRSEKLGQPHPYGRGHAIGLRDREFALARKLRTSQFHDHDRSAR